MGRVSRTYRVEDLPPCIAQRVRVDLLTGCWLWLGPPNGAGYGSMHIPGAPSGVSDGTHRLAYKHLVGPIPPERPQLDHLEERGCRWKICCNPDHLEPVTRAENARRSSVRIATRLHCGGGPAQHPWPDELVYCIGLGGVLRPRCMACNREHARAWRAARTGRP